MPQVELKMLLAGLIGLAMFGSPSAFGLSLDTLPQGIRSPQFRYGAINHLDQNYHSNGELWKLSDLHSINFDAATLAQVNPDARTLIRALDAFGSQNLGRDINMGTLVVETKPEITYQAAIFGYGVSDSWTLALAVPVIHYVNNTRLSSIPGNLDFYRSQLHGQSEALDRAFNMDLVSEAQKSISMRGYRPLDDRDQKFIGDAQLVSVKKINTLAIPAMLQTSLVLPTGPADDADDLLALNRFHHTEISNTLALGVTLSNRLLLLPYLELNIPLPERVDKRVPKDALDNLPDANQKESVNRQRGVSATMGSQVDYSIDRKWTLSGAYQIESKGRDNYQGDNNARYDLLEDETDSQSQKVKTELRYSTVQSYLSKDSLIPMTLAFNWSDTIAGKNVSREQINEITMILFF